MLVSIGDLVDDVVVRLGGEVAIGADTDALITRRRGGSAANVAHTTATLGGRARFIGRVGDDPVGTGLVADLDAVGVDTSHVQRVGITSTIVVLVDATGERSFLTDRRACAELEAPDRSWIDGASVVHVPLYTLADGPAAVAAATVIGWAHERRVRVSIDVSSTSLVDRFGRRATLELIESLRPDVVLANVDEAAALAIDGPVAGAVTVVKRGPDPAILHRPGRDPVEVETTPMVRVPDSTGAGDAFAAGFLLAGPDDLVAAIEAGHRAAEAVISHRT